MSAKKQQIGVGLTANIVDFPVNPDIKPAANPARRVLIARPAPLPVLRVCAYCGGTFEDYSKRPNTKYCGDSHRVSMSKCKRESGIVKLAAATRVAWDTADTVWVQGGMKALESALTVLGYAFDESSKDWIKR